jgi:hypothetical protein
MIDPPTAFGDTTIGGTQSPDRFTNSQGNPATGYLAAVKLPQSGRYTVGISSRRGAGDFTLRVIDGD